VLTFIIIEIILILSLNSWEKTMTNKTKKYSYSDDLVSDLHKDAWGLRPTQGFWHHWGIADQDAKQAIWDNLIDDMVKNDAEEAERKKANASDFTKRIKEVCKLGAGNYKTAIKWILDADGNLEDKQCYNDAGYLCFLYGLDFKFEKVFLHFLDIKCPITWSNGRAFI